MKYLGDYAEDYADLNFKFSTHKADGTPYTLAGTPAVSVYKSNSTTQTTEGITLTTDFDGVTGLNNIKIDLSSNSFYETGKDYQVVITTGTVNSVSVVSTVLAHFSIENRFQEVDVTKLGGSTQSATDLKDLADTGYDPSTHRISADATAISGDSTAADNLESACDNYSVTRGLAGTALPAAAADAAGGLPISDAGGLDLDTVLGRITDARMGALTDWINGGRLDLILDAIAADVAGLDGAAMRGTDGAALASAWTATRAGYIDTLISRITAAVALNSDMTTLLSRLSSDRAGYLDNLSAGAVALASVCTELRLARLNADIDSRMATFTYTAPDNANITSIINAINNVTYGLNALLTAINSRLAGEDYTAPDNSGIADIKTKTEQLTFTTPNKVDATATVSTEGIATEAKQDDIITHLTDIKGAEFSAADSLKSIRDRGDSAWITGSGLSGSNAVVINVHDDDGANIVEAAVEVWDSAGTTFYERKTSDSSGQASFNMDDGTYTVKIHKAGYSKADQTLVVPDTLAPVYVMTAYSIPAPSDAALCRLYAYMKNADGTIPETVKASLTIMSLPQEVGNTFFSGASIAGVYSSSKGLLYFDVIQGASVRLRMEAWGVDETFPVPPVATADIGGRV